MNTIEKLVRNNVLEMSAYRSARDEITSEAKIFLDANENAFDWAYSRYPDPKQLELRQKIADWRKVNVSQIMLGNGSDEIIDLLIRAFCNPGKDHIRILDPSYGMYEVSAALNQVEIIKTDLTKDFDLDTEEICYSDNEKLFFICSPNNPTGNCFQDDEIAKILNRFPGMVIIDEAYIDFSSRKSWIKNIGKYDNLIILQTFSKFLAAANLRVGMCFGNETLIEILLKIKPPYNLSGIVQKLAITRLDQVEKIQTQITELITERDKLKYKLEQCSTITKIFPSEANFLLAKAENAEKLYNHLYNQGIIVRNRSKEKHCKNCLRISIGSPPENLAAIDAIQGFK